MTTTTITQVSKVPQIALFIEEAKSTIDSLLDILEKYESATDPISASFAARCLMILQAQNETEKAKAIFLLSVELQNAPTDAFAQELQGWVDGLPPEAMASVNPLELMSQLLVEQIGIRTEHQRQLQTIFTAFQDDLERTEKETRREVDEMVQETASRIEGHRKLHQRDVQQLQSTHQLQRGLDQIQLDDVSTRLTNSENQLSGAQQRIAQLQARVNQMQSQNTSMQQQLAQGNKKRHGVHIRL